MTASRRTFVSTVLLIAVGAAPAARAQWAVIDVQAVAHLAQEVQTLQQALATAQAQLAEARLSLQAMSGTRGMQRLLAGTVRNYLPADWAGIASLGASGGGNYSGLAANVRGLVAANAVLPAAMLAMLAPADRARLVADRARVATDQAIFRSALANASARFAAVQTLIDAIPTATDPKSILDLQARIGAENGMLQDERNKLLVLAQSIQAEGAAAELQRREAIVAAQGRFETRFRPAP